MGVRKGTPAAREDRLSFFKEISQKQLASYQPDQIAKILRQRENVRENRRKAQQVHRSTAKAPHRFNLLSSETRFKRTVPRSSAASLSPTD